MKAKNSTLLTCLVCLFILYLSACKKEKSESAKVVIPVTNQIEAKDFYIKYKANIVCTCAGNKYLLDMDGDRIADAQISILCGSYYHIHCSYGSYTRYYDIANMDTLFNSKISIASSPNSLNVIQQFSFGDTIQPLGSYTHNNVLILYNSYQIYDFFNPSNGPDGYSCDSTIKYIGYREDGVTGIRCGWLALHFDSQFNVYLDGVFLSGRPNQAIRAGMH